MAGIARVVRAHMAGEAAPVLWPAPVIPPGVARRQFLREGISAGEARRLRRHTRTGRPCGRPGFVERLERLLARPLKPGGPGPKPSSNAAEDISVVFLRNSGRNSANYFNWHG